MAKTSFHNNTNATISAPPRGPSSASSGSKHAIEELNRLLADAVLTSQSKSTFSCTVTSIILYYIYIYRTTVASLTARTIVHLMDPTFDTRP